MLVCTNWKKRLLLVTTLMSMTAKAAEWHMVPDDLNPDVPITEGPIIGAVLVDSIKKSGDHAEARVSMFYNYDLIQTAISKIRDKHSDVRSKVQAAVVSGRASAYIGMEKLFTQRGAGFIGSSDDEIPMLLVASEVLIDEGYAPMSVRSIQVRCKSKVDFEYRYDGFGNWGLAGSLHNGTGKRGELFPFICDKLGMGQNDPAPLPPPSPEMVMLENIFHMNVLPKWKFLGIRTDQYARNYFVFFGADTIQMKDKYTDVIVASTQYEKGYGFPSSPEAFISELQAGQRRQGAIVITHIHCDTESIEGYSEAKMFEDQLVSYVCAHEQRRSGKTKASAHR